MDIKFNPMDVKQVFELTNKYIKALSLNSRIYICGICGTAMAPLAILLKELGHQIAGCDKAFYPPMSNLLEDNNIETYSGFEIHDLVNFNPDFVVIGNSIRSDNLLASYIIEQKIPFSSQAQMLSEVLIGNDINAKTIVVSGTHGKTTTTGIIAYLLSCSGYDPGFFIGGFLEDLGTSIQPKSESDGYCVLEGDEYDTAFFLKQPKFLSYKPKFVVVTSLEFDHADIYSSLEDIEGEFEKLVSIIPSDGHLLVCSDYPNLRKLKKDCEKRFDFKVCSYSKSDNGSDSYITQRTQIDNDGIPSQVVEAFVLGEKVSFSTTLLGEHNALNFLAAFHLLKISGVPLDSVLSHSSSFQGPKRRGQVIYDDSRITLIEDFAHHPTAVNKTIAGLKESYANRDLLAIFEPRSNTSRRSIFQDAYQEALSRADYLIVKNVNSENIYSSSGTVEDFLDVQQLCRAFDGKQAVACAESQNIVESVKNIIKNKEKKYIIVVMSNGDFDGIISKLNLLLTSLMD